MVALVPPAVKQVSQQCSHPWTALVSQAVAPARAPGAGEAKRPRPQPLPILIAVGLSSGRQPRDAALSFTRACLGWTQACFVASPLTGKRQEDEGRGRRGHIPTACCRARQLLVPCPNGRARWLGALQRSPTSLALAAGTLSEVRPGAGECDAGACAGWRAQARVSDTVRSRRVRMPRRPTSSEAVRVAHFFLEGFIERTDSQDHILPKNDTFSPFCGFCRVFPEVWPPGPSHPASPNSPCCRVWAARARVSSVQRAWKRPISPSCRLLTHRACARSTRRKRMGAQLQTAYHVLPSTRFVSNTLRRACASQLVMAILARWSLAWPCSAGISCGEGGATWPSRRTWLH